MNKTFANAEAALDGLLRDNLTIAAGGFGLCGIPENLIAALQAAGKEFEHRIYEAAPGGHHFNRIDTALAVESRAEIYAFFRRHLQKSGGLSK